MSVFHLRLKDLKDSAGKTQADMAVTLGLSPQNLSYYFNGREPNFELLVRIADYFDVSTDYLLGRTNVKRSDVKLNQIEELQVLCTQIIASIGAAEK